MDNINIRNGTPEDADTIAHFQKQMAMETEDKALEDDLIKPGVQAIFESPDKGFYLVAEIEEAIVGSLLVTYEWSDWRNSWFWWIQSVYVEKSHRRRGIYSRLYNEVISKCRKSEQTCGIRLYVEKENKIAQKVYSDLGMCETNYRLYEAHL